MQRTDCLGAEATAAPVGALTSRSLRLAAKGMHSFHNFSRLRFTNGDDAWSYRYLILVSRRMANALPGSMVNVIWVAIHIDCMGAAKPHNALPMPRIGINRVSV